MRRILFLLMIVTQLCNAQTMPTLNYIPSSPVASNYLRYGDIPVDLSTGVPSIGIPIYTLKSRSLSVPISLSYHASGIKVNDVSSEVGIGWIVNAGGDIHRVICGGPDEVGTPPSPPSYYKTVEQLDSAHYAAMATNQSSILNSFDYLTYLQQIPLDHMTDRFMFRLPNGKSGVFRKDIVTNEVKMIPYKPIKVDMNPQKYQYGQIESINMTDDDGTNYYFEKAYGYQSQNWAIKKIVSADKRDSILFYSHTEAISYNSFNDRLFYPDANNTTPYPSLNDRTNWAIGSPPIFLVAERNNFENVFYDRSEYYDYPCLTDSIVSANAKITFTYSNDRQDRQNGSYNPHARLTKILVSERNSQVGLQEIDFSQSYKDGRMMLDSVKNGADNYSFQYNNTVTAPPYTVNNPNSTGHSAVHEDFWGYYNGSTTDTKVPEFNKIDGPYTSYEGVTKYPDENYAQMLLLKQIKYPTGGKSVFEFELNKADPHVYDYIASDKPTDGKVGGLRIKKIYHYESEAADPIIKSYEYTFSFRSNYGEIRPALFQYRNQTYYVYSFQTSGTGSAEAPSGVFTGSNVVSPVAYSRMIGMGAAPVVYDKITEYIGTPQNNTGKTVYYYTTDNSSDTPSPTARFENPYSHDIGNYEPKLLKQEIFKFANNAYVPVKTQETLYSEYKIQTFSTGMNMASDFDFVLLNQSSFLHDGLDYYIFVLGNGEDFYSNHWIRTSTDAKTEALLPYKQTTTDYTENSASVISERYFDYNDFLYPKTETQVNSDGITKATEYKYVSDFSTSHPYAEMISKNNIRPTITQTNKSNGNITTQTKTDYSFWDNGQPVTYETSSSYPKTVSTSHGSLNYEPRIEYHSYDAFGNPTEVSKIGGALISYLWGYKNVYPIAECKNAFRTEFFYEGYEESIGSNLVVGNAHTGTKYTTSPTISWPAPTGRSYVISYWYLDGGIWKYSSPQAYTGSLTMHPGANGYDDVCIYPADAEITTYTYSPLVGMTSATDAKGQTTYYQYDSFQRLINIKDQDGNILKHMDYHYQGQ